MDPSAIGERLRLLRELAGANQSEASEIASLTRTHFRLLENGERPEVTSKTLSKVAEAFNCTLDWLIDGRGEPPTEAEVKATAVPRLEAIREAARRARERRPTGTES